MEERAVVTCVLRHGPEILLLRRSDAVGSYRGRWGAVSGYAEGAPDEAARWEIREEVGLLDTVDLVRSADPIDVEDESRDVRWLVHPYCFDCESTAVDPNEEIAAYEWVQPPTIFDRETVPGLWEAYASVGPTVETVRADEAHGSAYVSLRALEVLRDRAAEITQGRAEVALDDLDGRAEVVLDDLARRLRAARPGMGVVATRVDRVMNESDGSPWSVLERVLDACEQAVRSDTEAAMNAAEVVGERVLTLSRSGTVREALRRAAPEAVYVAESRPAREGVDAAERLASDGLDVTLCVDAAMAHVVGSEAVDTVLVGADSVLADGAVVNKVGTRLAALTAAAADADVDCYAVCSRDKVVADRSVTLTSGPPEAVHDRSASFAVRNPVFERTPAHRFAGVATEDGVCDPDDVERIADEHAELAGWFE